MKFNIDERLTLNYFNYQGSTYVYINFIHPFLEAHEDDIDAALADAKVKAKQVGLDYLNRGIQKLKQAVLGTLAVS